MAYTPISGIVPQLSRNAGGAAAGGYYLKGYSAGTTTPLSMGTDSTPTATLAKCKLNSRGEPISNDADETTVFIPHYNASYKLVLYVTEADADNNTTANAVWVVDNISGVFDASQVNYTASVTVAQRLDNLDVDDYTDLRALTSAQLTDGDSITVTDDGIAGDFVVKTGTVTDNGGTLIVFTDDSNRYVERIFQGATSAAWFGVSSSSADNTAAINSAVAYMRNNTFDFGFPRLEFPVGNLITLSALDFTNLRQSFLVIDFMGATISYEGTGGGESLLEMVGTRNVFMTNGYLRGESTLTNAAECGIFMGRKADGSVASKNTFMNMTVNGYFSIAGFYNYAGERTTCYSCNWNNLFSGAESTIVTRTNIDTPTTIYETAGTADASCNHHAFYGGEFRALPDRSTMYIEGATEVVILNPYFRCDVPSGNNASVILVDADSGAVSGLYALGMYWESNASERPDYGINFTGNAKGINEIKVNCVGGNNANLATFLINTNNQVNNMVLEGSSSNATDTGTLPLVLTTGSTSAATLHDVKLHTRNDATVDLSGIGEFTGEVYVSDPDDLSYDDTTDPFSCLLRTKEGMQIIDRPKSITISGGLIDPRNYQEIFIDTEASAGTDDLDYILIPGPNNDRRGASVTITPNSTGRNIVCKNNLGSPPAGYAKLLLKDGADVTLDASPAASTQPAIRLFYSNRASAWVQT